MELGNHLVTLIWTLFQLVVLLLWFALIGAPMLLWIAWWLWAVDWRKLWPTLTQGAWAVVVLLALVVAMVLTFVLPGAQILAGTAVPGPWWQLGAVAMALAVAFLCGWVQGLFGWYPPEPKPAPAAEQGHETDPGRRPEGHSQHHP